jgi:hypothetical protein
MNHTHLVLDDNYVPQDDNEKDVFWEMQTFMYSVMADHLKTDKRKSLVSQYERTRDTQSIYRDLVKHALDLTSAWVSGDDLLRCITTARYPDNWRGTAFYFVLHWQEQVWLYERLELEAFLRRQKIFMIQNDVCEATVSAHVKQLADLGISNGNKALTYDNYVDLLLEACSTFDKRRALPERQKRAMYLSVLSDNDLNYPYDSVQSIPS